MSGDYSEITPALPVPEYVPRPQPTIIPTAAWNDTPLFCLRVNDEWVSHILGVMSALDQPDTWIGTEEEIYAARQQVNEIMLMLMTVCEDTMSYPQHATLWHYQSRIVSGAGMTNISLADAPFSLHGGWFNLLSYQDSIANGDSFEQPVSLAAGDYDFSALGAKNQYGGLLDWYLDGDLFWTGEDFYDGSVQINIIEHATLTIPTDGNHILTGVVNGTSSPSGLHFVPLINYWFDLTP